MIYLDNAATTYPKPECVYEFANNFYRDNGVYQSRGNYNASKKVNRLIEETREDILRLFNAPSNYKAIFTSSSTVAINAFLQGYKLKKEMNIYTTGLEHNAVNRTLEALSKKYCIKKRQILLKNHNLRYNINDIINQFVSNPPDMIIVNHASNVCGLIAPIDEIFKLGKQYNSINLLDASQTSGLLNISLKNKNIDCVIFSGHKSLYAPFGIAGMVLNSNICLEPLIYGGTGINSSDLHMPEFYPERLEAGSVDIYAIAGLNASLKWIEKIGINNIHSSEEELLKYTIECFKELPQVKCYTPSGKQIAILAFTVYGYSPDEVSEVLNTYDIAVRSGLHCAPDAHRLIGTLPEGTVRMGFNFFNNKKEVDIVTKVISTL